MVRIVAVYNVAVVAILVWYWSVVFGIAEGNEDQTD